MKKMSTLISDNVINMCFQILENLDVRVAEFRMNERTFSKVEKALPNNTIDYSWNKNIPPVLWAANIIIDDEMQDNVLEVRSNNQYQEKAILDLNQIHFGKA